MTSEDQDLAAIISELVGPIDPEPPTKEELQRIYEFLADDLGEEVSDILRIDPQKLPPIDGDLQGDPSGHCPNDMGDARSE